MADGVSKQTLAVLVAVVLVISVVGTWMVMSSDSVDVDVPRMSDRVQGDVKFNLPDGKKENIRPITGDVVYSFN